MLMMTRPTYALFSEAPLSVQKTYPQKININFFRTEDSGFITGHANKEISADKSYLSAYQMNKLNLTETEIKPKDKPDISLK